MTDALDSTTAVAPEDEAQPSPTHFQLKADERAFVGVAWRCPRGNFRCDTPDRLTEFVESLKALAV